MYNSCISACVLQVQKPMNSTLQNFTGLPLMPKTLQNRDMDSATAEQVELAAIGYELVSLSS